MPRADWREAVDASGKTYYVNDALRKTVWTLDGEDVSDASDSSEKGEPSSGGSTNAKSRSTSSGGGSSSSSSSTTTTKSRVVPSEQRDEHRLLRAPTPRLPQRPPPRVSPVNWVSNPALKRISPSKSPKCFRPL
ncbi:hypothetical protein DIPPA_00004 [Diplonema papillatum]|nr:hypothetical protein DIPPA_00004 [Diplonema papillatum]